MVETISLAQYKAFWKLPKSTGEETLALQLKDAKIAFTREFRFCLTRRWRADFALRDKSILVEVEGGSWSNGSHSRGKGFEEDCEKYAEAVLMGWYVMRFTTRQVGKGYAIDCIKRALKVL